MTYGSIRDTKQPEKHILISSWCDFRHHRLRIRIIQSLKKTEEDVVDPEIADVVVPNFLSPQPKHSIEWDKDRKSWSPQTCVSSLDQSISECTKTRRLK